MKKRGNPDAAPPVAPSAAAEPRPESPALAPFASEPVLLENDPAVATAPSESMAGGVTVEPNEAIGVSPASSSSAAVLLENDPAVATAPSESMAGGVTVEPNEAIGVPSAAPASSSSAGPVAQSPRAVRVLPRRPRLRTTFHYDPSDALNVELTLMDDRRELIHRMTLVAAPGGAIARIFEALLGVVTQAAASAGVFGNRER